MPCEGQSAIVTELYIGVSSVLIVKLRESETRMEQTAPSRSDEFLTIAETENSLGEELGWHIKRTASKPRDKLRKRLARAAIQ